MSDLPQSTRLTNAQTFLTRIGLPEFDQVVELLSPQVSYSVLGNSALSGVFTGRQQVVDHISRLMDRTSGRVDVFKWEDWLIGVHHVAALADIHVELKGAVSNGRHLFVLKFDASDLIDQVTVFFEDAAAAERFYGSA
jgi:hypothetical protein